MKKINKAKLERLLDIAWSEYVRRRDRVCQKCGGHGAVSAHHAFGRRHRSTRWDVMNGVGLCYPCHIHWAHRDPAGFSVWFEEHIGRDQYLRLSEAHRMIVKYSSDDMDRMLSDIKEMSKDI